jgi:hypothetical protein
MRAPTITPAKPMMAAMTVGSRLFTDDAFPVDRGVGVRDGVGVVRGMVAVDRFLLY